MRTKTLLLTAAVVAAGISASQAQVYSVNAVGYVNVQCGAGFNLISNPLNSTNNTIGYLLTGFPNFGAQFYKWTGSDFQTATYSFGNWGFDEDGNDLGLITLAPGEGGFLNLAPSAAPRTITFVGDVMQGNLSNSIPPGYSIRSSIVPQSGGVTALGLTAALSNFSTILKWDRSINDYGTYSYVFGGWTDPSEGSSEPQVNVGEAFFINSNSGVTNQWTRAFSVN